MRLSLRNSQYSEGLRRFYLLERRVDGAEDVEAETFPMPSLLNFSGPSGFDFGRVFGARVVQTRQEFGGHISALAYR